jgi:hypothetical protein
MQLPKRRPHPSPAPLLYLDSSQTEPWTRLGPRQQQTCQELLSQLLQQVAREPSESDRNEADGNEERRGDA